MPKRLILLSIFIILAACTERNQPDSVSKEVNSSNNLSAEIKNYPSKITYLRMKADFSRRVDKGFTIVTLDLKKGIEKEYKNDSYENVEIMGQPNPHPSGEKVITDVKKYNGAPNNIVEIDLKSGEVSTVPNIAPGSLLPRYATDGKKIVYHDAMNAENHARVVIYDIEEEKGEHLPCNGLRCWQPDWHPDGTKVVFVEDKKKIIEYDLVSRTQTTRFALNESQSGIEVSDPRYSPDGKKLLFLESTIRKVSLSNYREQDIEKLVQLNKNNTATVVYERKGIFGVEWCPDSRHIVYSIANFRDRKNLSEMQFT